MFVGRTRHYMQESEPPGKKLGDNEDDPLRSECGYGRIEERGHFGTRAASAFTVGVCHTTVLQGAVSTPNKRPRGDSDEDSPDASPQVKERRRKVLRLHKKRGLRKKKGASMSPSWHVTPSCTRRLASDMRSGPEEQRVHRQERCQHLLEKYRSVIFSD